MFSDLYIRFRSLFRRASVESELNEELRFHRDRQLKKYSQSGLTYEEAIRRFRLEFGGLDQVKEECREVRGVTFLETLAWDIRYALDRKSTRLNSSHLGISYAVFCLKK